MEEDEVRSIMSSMENDEMVSIKSIPSFRPHLQRMFSVRCHHHGIVTTVTFKPSVVRRWIHNIRRIYGRELGRRLVVGLGVQWIPRNLRAAATLQLCVGRHCLIFQILHAPHIPLVLRRFLNNPVNNFVGVRNYHDRKVLTWSKHRIRVSNLINVCDVAAAKKGYRRGTSMRELADSILKLNGVKKDTTVGRSNWGAESLSEGQVLYACLDAFIAFELGKKLQVWDKITDH